MRSRGLALIVVGLLVLGACSDGAESTATTEDRSLRPACTLIGCTSGVFWRVEDSVSADWPRPLTFEACIDDHCETTEISADQLIASHRTSVSLYDGIDLEADHVATVRVIGPDGSVLLEREDVVALASKQPNGPSCPPTCWQATIVVDQAG